MIRVQAPKPTAVPAAPASNELLVLPFTIITDTREQAPWTFTGLQGDSRDGHKQLVIKNIVGTLRTGDYSVQGCEDWLTVERKSLDDFLSSITAGRQRFEREHERMAAMVRGGGSACVIIESENMKHIPPVRNISSESVLGTVASWPQRYGVPWHFAGDRRDAEKLCFRILRGFWERWEETGGDVWDKRAAK